MIEMQSTPRVRLGLLIGVHLLLGVSMAAVALTKPGFGWPGWIHIWFLALISSEMLLLGLWLGLAETQRRFKLFAFGVGIGWMTGVSLSAVSNRDGEKILQILGFVTPPVLVVAGASVCCRQWLARIRRGDTWPVRPMSEELQFTLRSIIALTVAVSLLLAVGRIVRAIDEGRGDAPMAVFVFSLMGFLSGAMLVWACLGLGRVAVRVPAALTGMAAVGLIFPYYLGGQLRQFIEWPMLTLLISAFVVTSLLVVRGCGYRLVPISQQTRP